MKYFVFLGLLALLASAFGRWRFISARDRSKKQRMRSKLSGAEVAQRLLEADANTRGKVKIVEHNAYLSDYYDPALRRLYLSEPVYHGSSAASWGMALHEAGHAIQQREGDPALKLRRGMVKLSLFGGGMILIVTVLLAIAPMIPPRVAIMAGVTLFFLVALGNVTTIGTEYAANRWVNKRIEGLRVLRGVDEEEELEAMMAGACWRELGDVVRSPLIFLYHLVPLLGRKPRD